MLCFFELKKIFINRNRICFCVAKFIVISVNKFIFAGKKKERKSSFNAAQYFLRNLETDKIKLCQTGR